MNALLRLLVVGRFAATVRNQVRIACIRAAVGAALAVLVLTAVVFLLAAIYQVLSWHYSGPVAALLMALGLLVLAALVALVGYLVLRRHRRRPEPASSHADPISAGLGTIGSALGSIPPGVLIAALAGFLYGMRGKGR